MVRRVRTAGDAGVAVSGNPAAACEDAKPPQLRPARGSRVSILRWKLRAFPLGVVEERLVLVRKNSLLGIFAGQNELLLFLVPVRSAYLALEGHLRADAEGDFRAWGREGGHLNDLAKSHERVIYALSL